TISVQSKREAANGPQVHGGPNLSLPTFPQLPHPASLVVLSRIHSSVVSFNPPFLSAKPASCGAEQPRNSQSVSSAGAAVLRELFSNAKAAYRGAEQPRNSRSDPSAGGAVLREFLKQIRSIRLCRLK